MWWVTQLKSYVSTLFLIFKIFFFQEKIVFLEKTIRQKENQMITKDQEITQMQAQLFNEERLIREKLKKMASVHEEKVGELKVKVRSLQSEI